MTNKPRWPWKRIAMGILAVGMVVGASVPPQQAALIYKAGCEVISCEQYDGAD